MVRKGILGVMLMAALIFSYGIAHAQMIDGMNSYTGPTTPTAMYVNPGGTGDALLYGYYNVRGGNLNFLRVVNTSETTGVAVKIRFREGHNSTEVRDFFICLSAADQWTGWIADNNGVGEIISWDKDTPTDPALGFGQSFQFAYGNPYSGITADNTLEGEFEVIGVDAWADKPGPDNKAISTTAECDAVATNPSNAPVTVYDAPNSLMGENILFNLGGDQVNSYAYNATAIANCRTSAVTNAGLGADDHPRLDDCSPATAANGLTEVNFALTKSNLYGTYDVESVLGGQTDYVISFPTRTLSIKYLGDEKPFNGAYSDDTGLVTEGETSESKCETIGMTVYDDAENTPQGQIQPSPRTQGGILELCDEVNVIAMGANATPLLQTDLKQFNVDLESAGFSMGWANIDLTKDSNMVPTVVDGYTALGLPAIGYKLQDYSVGSLEVSPFMTPLKYNTTFTAD